MRVEDFGTSNIAGPCTISGIHAFPADTTPGTLSFPGPGSDRSVLHLGSVRVGPAKKPQDAAGIVDGLVDCF